MSTLRYHSLPFQREKWPSFLKIVLSFSSYSLYDSGSRAFKIREMQFIYFNAMHFVHEDTSEKGKKQFASKNEDRMKDSLLIVVRGELEHQ